VRLATPLTVIALAAVLAVGCGSSDEGTTAPPKPEGANVPASGKKTGCVLNIGGTSGLYTIGVSCGKAQKLALAWRKSAECAVPDGASRAACSVSGYRCLTARTGRGFSVACARPGRSIAFTARD
jgi:hypothetical protein